MSLPALSTASGQILVAVAVAAVVVMLYLLKPSPRRLSVSSTLIWRRVLRSRKRTSERLRWWLSLLLALLIALSIALSVTRPHLAGSSASPGKVVLVLDDSITLSALTSDGRTRWEHAVERARQLIHSGAAGSQYQVADTQRQIASPRFEEAAAALATLERLHAQAGSAAVFPALLETQGSDVRTVLITDGVAPLALPSYVQTLSVFQAADNAGITAFQVRAMPVDPRRQQAYVEVTNASRGTREVEVSVTGAGHAPLSRRLSLAAAASAGEVFDVSMFTGGPLRASISMAGDAMSVDDAAFSYLPLRRVLRVGLVSSGNATLERSLRLLPRVELAVIPPGRYGARSGTDVWVLDRYAPKQAPVLPALLFRPSRVEWLPAIEGVRGEAAVSAWMRGHPLTDGLSLRDVLIRSALIPHTDSRFEVIAADAERRALILASVRGPRRVEALFALDDSNLSLQPGFPVLLANALDWLTGDPRPLQVGVGPVELPVRAAKVLDLQGRAIPVRELPDGTLFEARQPGFFTAVAAEGRVPVAVSVADPALTRINASRLAELPPAPPQLAIPTAWRTQAWVLLLFAAAMLLTLEWWTFNRRLTV